MKTVSKDVKHEGVVKATLEIPQYETVEEISEALETATIISYVNRMIVTDTMNKERAKYRAAPASQTKRKQAAFNLLPLTTFEDGETGLEKLTAIVGSDKSEAEKEAAVNALLESKEVQANVDKKLGTSS